LVYKIKVAAAFNRSNFFFVDACNQLKITLRACTCPTWIPLCHCTNTTKFNTARS